MKEKTMFALVKDKEEKGLWLREIPLPELGQDDVLVKILKTAICGTDLHIYNWDDWAQENIPVPLTIGHEFVGEIVALGDNVEGFSLGERVSGEGHVVCGRCRNCYAGKRHLCGHAKGIGVHRDGAFAQYLSLPASNVWRCAPEISDEVVSIFDPLGNAVHTALKFDLVGEDVLITGAGPIGIMAVAICKHVGARHIVITDLNEYRLDIARKMGATVALNIKEKTLSQVMEELGMKEGFDVGLEMSGASPAFSDMVDHMRVGGSIALLGLLSQDTKIDWDKIVFGAQTIEGIYGREIFETWYKMTSMLQSGLDVDQVITHRFSFRDYEKGFDVMNAGLSGKVILDWTEDLEV